MDLEGRKISAGTNAVISLNDADNSVLSTNARSTYEYSVLKGEVFYAANQSAATWSVALNTTHTGFVLSNPVTSGKNIILLKVGFALSVAPAAIAHIGLFTGYSTAGIVTHTTPLTPYSCAVGTGSSIMNADAAATLVGTPTWALPFMGGFTAAALPSTSPAVINIDGLIVVKPGGYVGVGALTAVVGYASMIWKETSVNG